MGLRPTESEEQQTLFEWVRLYSGKYPELDLLYHVPNGGKRPIKTAVQLSQEGVKAGVPDLCLPVARGPYHGLYIELKVGYNKPTEKQKEWIRRLRAEGYLAEVCYGWADAWEHLMAYLNQPKVREGQP